MRSLGNDGWDAIAFQEVAGAGGVPWVCGKKVDVDGHILYVNDHKSWDTCILVHKRWQGKTRALGSCAWGLAVRIQCDSEAWVLASSHLPNARSYDDDTYRQACADVSSLLLPERGKATLVLACDANVELAPGFLPDEVAGPVLLGNSTAPDERQIAFCTLLGDLQLRLANTWLPTDADGWTHKSVSPRGIMSYRQIDWMGISQVKHECSCDIRYKLAAGSDHVAMRLRVWSRGSTLLTFWIPPKSAKGWKPESVGQAEYLRTCLDLDSSASVDDWQSTCERVMQDMLSWPVAPRQSLWHDRLADARAKVEECQLAWCPAPSPAAMRRAARRLRRARRSLAKLRKQQDLEAGKCIRRHGRMPSYLEGSTGEKEYDQGRWPPLLRGHFREKFQAADEESAENLRLLAEAEAVAAADRLDGRPGARVHDVDVELAAKSLPTGVSPAGDNVPAELLSVLEAHHYQALAASFQRRIRGVQDTKQADAWRSCDVVVTPKKGRLEKLPNWRGLFLCCSLFKVYETVLDVVASRCMRALPKWILGFQKKKTPLQISECLRILFLKAAEWNLPLICGSLDVKAAFDELHCGHVYHALRRRGCPSDVAAAILREHVALRAKVRMGTIGFDEWLYLWRGCPQGRRKTPKWWNVVLADALEAVVRGWLGSLAWLPDWSWPSMLWADNLYLVSSSIDGFQEMATAATQALHAKDLRWSQTSLQCLANPAALALGDCNFRAGDDPMVLVDVLEVLGTHLDARGSSATSLGKKLAKATGSWHSQRPALADSRLSWTHRCHKFYSEIGGAVLFGMEGLAPTAADADRLERWENSCLRTMVASKRRADEAPWRWVQRCTDRAHVLRRRAGCRSLVESAWRAHHRWMGRLATMPPGRCPAADALRWKSLAEWRALQAVGGNSTRQTGWRHPTRRRFQHIEHAMESVHGVDWQALARHSLNWLVDEDHFVRHLAEQWQKERVLLG